MPPVPDDDWSDSDEEVLSEVETSVLLGVPDGPITAEADINDALVSRIGGYPVRSLYTYRRIAFFNGSFFRPSHKGTPPLEGATVLVLAL